MKKSASAFLHFCLQHLVWYLVKTLTSTYRIEVRGKENADKAKLLNPNGSFIFCVWHEQVISVMRAHAWTEPYLALSSRSKDGDYAAFVSEKMGFVAVRGSSKKRRVDKGGKEAMQEYVSKLNQGISGGITIDGPKGPRQQCKVGAVLISMQTGAPILPVVGIADRYWQFNSWDKFKIPKPFSKIVMLYGQPIQVARSAPQETIENVCQQVTQALKEMENLVVSDIN